MFDPLPAGAAWWVEAETSPRIWPKPSRLSTKSYISLHLPSRADFSNVKHASGVVRPWLVLAVHAKDVLEASVRAGSSTASSRRAGPASAA
jgi:hypothetical protein